MKENKKNLTKEDILDATEDCIRRFGSMKTSVIDIAKVLNVSHGSIYRHYKSKQDLMEDATRRWLENKVSIHAKKVVTMEFDSLIEHLKEYFYVLSKVKWECAKDDLELFQVYKKVTESKCVMVQNHVNGLIESCIKILEIHNVVLKDKEKIAKGIFFATSRLHGPSNYYFWQDEKIEEDFEVVWHIVEGYLKNII